MWVIHHVLGVSQCKPPFGFGFMKEHAIKLKELISMSLQHMGSSICLRNAVGSAKNESAMYNGRSDRLVH